MSAIPFGLVKLFEGYSVLLVVFRLLYLRRILKVFSDIRKNETAHQNFKILLDCKGFKMDMSGTGSQVWYV